MKVKPIAIFPVAPEPARVIIWAACALHYAWALLLVVNPAVARSTPVSVVVHACGGRWAAVVLLLTVAAAAQVAATARRWWPLLVPQQTLLMMSAGAGIYAAAVGHYADGVLRPWQFILADQLPVILAALLYSAALLTLRDVR